MFLKLATRTNKLIYKSLPLEKMDRFWKKAEAVKTVIAIEADRIIKNSR